jgi:hypothetical protein
VDALVEVGPKLSWSLAPAAVHHDCREPALGTPLGQRPHDLQDAAAKRLDDVDDRPPA